MLVKTTRSISAALVAALWIPAFAAAPAEAAPGSNYDLYSYEYELVPAEFLPRQLQYRDLAPEPSVEPDRAARAYERALSRFGSTKAARKKRKKKEQQRNRWAGRSFQILKYKREFVLDDRPMVFELRVPGKRGSWARVKLEF